MNHFESKLGAKIFKLGQRNEEQPNLVKERLPQPMETTTNVNQGGQILNIVQQNEDSKGELKFGEKNIYILIYS